MKEQERPLEWGRLAPFQSWGTGPAFLIQSADTSTLPKQLRRSEPRTKRGTLTAPWRRPMATPSAASVTPPRESEWMHLIPSCNSAGTK